MATLTAYVNQRQLSCKRLLSHYQQAVDDQVLPLNSLEDCYGVALQLQLLRYYQAYLRELMEQYKIALPSQLQQLEAVQLKPIMAKQGNHCIEIAELADLEQQTDWLRHLLMAASYLEHSTKPSSTTVMHSDIPLQQVTAFNPISLENCQQTYLALTAIIERQRDLYQEW